MIFFTIGVDWGCYFSRLSWHGAWKRIVELQGLDGLRQVKGYHDEPLQGEWRGFRSSRLSLKWRVIYSAEKEVCEIYVVDINPHKY